MSVDKSTVWSFCEDHPTVPDSIVRATEVALELGADPVSAGTGAFLRAVAAMRKPKAVVEVGTGAGASGLWILLGMQSAGVLTTIDPEAEYQRAAAQAFRGAQIPSPRTRFINGRALELLPRLADSSYDMAVLDGLPEETPGYLSHMHRILRPGAALVIPNALWFGNVADPARRDPHTVTMREVCRELEESEFFDLSLLPIGSGVALAVSR